MHKKFIPTAVLISLLLSSVAAAAADTCAPERLDASVDRYMNEPYGAAAWRKLQGLGDPDVEASATDYNNWQALDDWKKLVAELAPDVPGVQDAGYDCRIANPLQLLNERIVNFGKTAPYIKQWIMAQASVIAACTSSQNGQIDLPAALADQPQPVMALQAFDRDYQAASVAFYNDRPMAIELFRKIGASTSPHRAYARYNVANLLANGKDLIGARKEAKAILADASLSSVYDITQELLGYISNIEDTSAGWSELIDHTLSVLSRPEAQLKVSVQSKAEYAHALKDIAYAGVAAKESDWWVKGELPENPTLSKAIMDVSRKSPMATWMMAGQSVNANYERASWAMVGEKWHAWSASYIERAEALVAQPNGLSKDLLEVLKAKPDDATRAAVWSKARSSIALAVKSCGEAAETAAAGQLLLHAVRLSALAGKYDEAYQGLLASPIKSTKAYTERVVNKLAVYVLATGNAKEGRRLRDALLTPAFYAAVSEDQRQSLKAQYSNFLSWIAEDEAHWLDAVATSNVKLESPLFNLLPIKSLRAMAANQTFTSDQKALLLRAAWTREYAQGKEPNSALTAEMVKANPKLKDSYDAVAKEFPMLRNDRRWLLTILRNPRFGILINSPDYSEPIETPRADVTEIDQYDHNDKNWWCPLEPGRQMRSLRTSYDATSGGDVDLSYRKTSLEPAFDQKLFDKIAQAREMLLQQHPMVKALNRAEISNLAAMDSAPAKLTKAAIRWGKDSAGADGAPEALALAVQATRYGCNWHGGHKAYSKPAQELLKSKFGKTEWATKTPYWFDCVNVGIVKDLKGGAKCWQHDWPKDELPK
jgi:hypothetical protein